MSVILNIYIWEDLIISKWGNEHIYEAENIK